MAGHEPRSTVQMREATILTYDHIRMVCSAQFTRGEEIVEDIELYDPFSSRLGGAFMGGRPRKGDFVLLVSISDTSSWKVLAYKAAPIVETGGEGTELEQPRANFRMGREIIDGGDVGAWGAHGNKLVARADGVTEVICDELTFTRWFPDTHRIQEVAATLDREGPWGSSSFFTQWDERRIAEGVTPTGAKAWIKASAEGSPCVLLEAGGVPDEESVRLPGKTKTSERTKGSIRFRFLVFDPETADEYISRGEEPEPTQARFSFRVDEEGNVLWLTSGTRTESMTGLNQTVAGREYRQVLGSSKVEVRNSAQISSDETLDLQGKRGVDLRSGGDVRIACRRFQVDADNDSYDVRGDWRVSAGGGVALRGSASVSLTTAGEMTLTAGRSRQDTIGGTYNTTILNVAEAENRGRDVKAWGVRVKRGRAHLEAEKGSFVFSIGPTRNPMAEIRLHMDPLAPQQRGRISIGFPRTGMGLELDPRGGWELKSQRGGVFCDRSGKITIGDPNAGLVGHVVTTLSHPVDYITGSPIMGAANVTVPAGRRASMGSPRSLGIVPATVPVPETPVA